jgi:hypothetical protein
LLFVFVECLFKGVEFSQGWRRDVVGVALFADPRCGCVCSVWRHVLHDILVEGAIGYAGLFCGIAQCLEAIAGFFGQMVEVLFLGGHGVFPL